MRLVGLEGDLQDAVAQPVAVEAGDGHGRLVVICHGDEAEPFALVGVEVTDHFDVVDGAEGPEQLPQHALVWIRGQVVHEDAPASARVAGDVHAHQTGHAVNGDGGEPGGEAEIREREREEERASAVSPQGWRVDELEWEGHHSHWEMALDSSGWSRP